MNNTKIPVYLSLTSIYNNQNRLLLTLQSVLSQTLIPDKVFIYLSEFPSFFDNGFENKQITNTNLLNLINNNHIINIKWGKDIGPFGKLLPLLEDKWNEDCIIITIDDDTIYSNNLIENLVHDYYNYKCVINYRSFTPSFNHIDNFDYHKRKDLEKLSLYNFPTGKGGILYKPEFFKKTNNLIFDQNIYLNTCSKQDDIWFYIIRILNNIPCYTDNKKWHTKDITSNGLYFNYNSKNNENTKAFKKTIEKLKDLNYKL